MNCTVCNKPIVLVPSAEERARKYGNSASYYSNLFTTHADCALAKRKAETSALIHRYYSKSRKMK
jgi:hypothetical protein